MMLNKWGRFDWSAVLSFVVVLAGFTVMGAFAILVLAFILT